MPKADVAILACGALVREIKEVVRRHGWAVDLYVLPARLHNEPRRIPARIEEQLHRLSRTYRKVIVAYGDCGTGGALDRVLARFPNARRLAGPHCYAIYGGDQYERWAETHPGTFYLTDFLARGFDALVWKALGLDRHPELKDMYFAHYTDVVWLAQQPDDVKAASSAREAASHLGLPLTVIETGYHGLEAQLRFLIETWTPKYEPVRSQSSEEA